MIHQVSPFPDTRQPCNPVEDTTVGLQKESSDSDGYCALTKQRTDEQESQVYCELRSFNWQPLTKRKVENGGVYVNIT